MTNSKIFIRENSIIYPKCPIKRQLSLAGYAKSSVPGELTASERVSGGKQGGKTSQQVGNASQKFENVSQQSRKVSHRLFPVRWLSIKQKIFLMSKTALFGSGLLTVYINEIETRSSGRWYKRNLYKVTVLAIDNFLITFGFPHIISLKR